MGSSILKTSHNLWPWLRPVWGGMEQGRMPMISEGEGLLASRLFSWGSCPRRFKILVSQDGPSDFDGAGG